MGGDKGEIRDDECVNPFQQGNAVRNFDYAATFTDEERRLYALPADHMYVVYKV